MSGTSSIAQFSMPLRVNSAYLSYNLKTSKYFEIQDLYEKCPHNYCQA